MLVRLINDYTNIMFKSVVLTAICFISTSLEAQTYQQGTLENAKAQLSKAKENGIVIRFDTKEPILDSLKANGLMKLYEKKRKELEDFKLEIIAAFKEKYTYGKVYYSTSDDIVAARGESSFNVFDLDGHAVRVDPNSVLYLNPARVYLKEFRSEYIGFAVQDINFENLEKPFPYVVRRGSFLQKLTYPAMVEKLQFNFKILESK